MNSIRKNLRFYEKTSYLENLQKSVKLIQQSDPSETTSSHAQSKSITGDELKSIDFEIIPSLLFRSAVNPLPLDMTEASVVYDGKNNLILHPTFNPNLNTGEYVCSAARLTPTLASIGWDRLYIKSYSICSPVIQMWANGFLEGLLTSKEVFDFYDNLVSMDSFAGLNLNSIFRSKDSWKSLQILWDGWKSYSKENN